MRTNGEYIKKIIKEWKKERSERDEEEEIRKNERKGRS